MVVFYKGGIDGFSGTAVHGGFADGGALEQVLEVLVDLLSVDEVSITEGVGQLLGTADQRQQQADEQRRQFGVGADCLFFAIGRLFVRFE